MALLSKQSITLESQHIMSGQKIQGIIDEILPDKLVVRIPIPDLSVDQGIRVKISFWDSHSTYEFDSITIAKKDIGTQIIAVSKPEKITKVVNRSYERIDLNLQAMMVNMDGTIKQKCLINDLSAGGARVTGLHGKKVGDLVSFNFNLPNGELFEAINGIVVWIKDYKENLKQYGVEFDTLSEVRRVRLDNYIRHEIYTRDYDEDDDIELDTKL